MTLHLLVEGPSERAFLEPWLQRLLPGVPVKVHPHQGKGALPDDIDAAPSPVRRGVLDQLPAKLRAFGRDSSLELGVLVLVDADDDDCVDLANRIREVARHVAPELRFAARVAVEEMEAFYLGDLAALRRAYPDADLARAEEYDPDSVCGTWELFGQIVGDGGGNKVAWAAAMGPRVTTTPGKSRSPSFRALIRALKRLATPPEQDPAPARRYRHPPQPRGDSTRRR